MTTPQARATAFLSSRVNSDFERVEVAIGVRCPCGAQLRPFDFFTRQDRVEATCGSCDTLLFSVEAGEQ